MAGATERGVEAVALAVPDAGRSRYDKDIFGASIMALPRAHSVNVTYKMQSINYLAAQYYCKYMYSVHVVSVYLAGSLKSVSLIMVTL